MTAATNNPGSGQDPGATAIGGTTSGQTGATPAHESFAETGGNGGAQLTHSHGDNPDGLEAPRGNDSASEPNGDTASDVQSGARGAQDTRQEQGGGTGTGIGSRESGANQSTDDLPPR